MPPIKAKVRHHCGKVKGGNCRPHTAEGWCTQHNHCCYLYGWYFNIGDPCDRCEFAEIQKDKDMKEALEAVAKADPGEGKSVATTSKTTDQMVSKQERDRKKWATDNTAELQAALTYLTTTIDDPRDPEVVERIVQMLRDFTTTAQRLKIMKQIKEFTEKPPH